MLNEMLFTNIDPNLIIKQESSVVPPWEVSTFFVDISLVDSAKKETLNSTCKNLLNEILDSSPSYAQIYTDASKTNSGITIAIRNDDVFLSYKPLDHNSIYTMEYIALVEGVYVVIQLPDPNINICSDSLSILNNFKYNHHSSTLTTKICNIIANTKKTYGLYGLQAIVELRAMRKLTKYLENKKITL